MKHCTFSVLAFALLLPLTACSPSNQSSTQQPTDARAATDTAKDTLPSSISADIQKEMQQAKLEIANKNINVDSVHIGSHWHGIFSHSDAEITPQGDLLIADKKVAATPAQQALLLDYRSQIIGIADAGMDIGAQGADLGINAARQALQSIFSGKNGKDIDTAIKPQTDKIQGAANSLCQRLPPLLAKQQQLAAAMPEFRPYATMQQRDIDDCGKEMKDKNGKKGFAVFSD